MQEPLNYPARNAELFCEPARGFGRFLGVGFVAAAYFCLLFLGQEVCCGGAVSNGEIVPTLSLDRTSNHRIRNTKLAGQFMAGEWSHMSTRNVMTAEIHNIGIGQLRSGVFLSPLVIDINKSLLGYTILHIIPTCAQEHMVRIYAPAFVAFVTGRQPSWNCFVFEYNPSNPVCPLRCSVHAELSVSRRSESTSPQPALGFLVDCDSGKYKLLRLFPIVRVCEQSCLKVLEGCHTMHYIATQRSCCQYL